MTNIKLQFNICQILPSTALNSNLLSRTLYLVRYSRYFMTLGKVVGTVVATRKDEKLIGNRLMIVQEVDLDNELIRQYTVAVDSVGAGLGEVVLTVGVSSARYTEATKGKPVDAAIVAIVDTVEINGEIIYQK